MDGLQKKPRKEGRKEARLEKKKRRQLSWMEHKTTRNNKKKFLNAKPPANDFTPEKKPKEKLVSIDSLSSTARPLVKEKKKNGLKKNLNRKKTKFEEFIEMEINKEMMLEEDDLEMERKLAKKLKVKDGRVGGLDDGLDMLLDGLPSVLNSDKEDKSVDDAENNFEEGHESISSRKKRKRKKPSGGLVKLSKDELSIATPEGEPGLECEVSEQLVETEKEQPIKVPTTDGSAKYVTPHLRTSVGKESEELSHIRRRVRGLLNRLSESNLESVTEEVATISQSIGRSVACQVIGEEVLLFSGGPRGNEQHAATFAAFVAGMACLIGIDFGAKLIVSLAKSFEDVYRKEDNLSLRNIILLLSYLYIFGVCSSDLLYDFLCVLSKRLTELDVYTILTILQCCGMKLRSDDPTSMKEFILSIQNRVNELKSIGSPHDGQQKINSKRMEFMLETICEIKNNKKRAKEDPAHYTRIKKWLQKLRSEDVLLRGLKWSKLLDPEKKGQWWLSGEVGSTVDDVKEVASTIDREVLEAQKLVQLAAAQRMNTDVRRAIFCIIMSGEDYIDAFEKLLRLDLSGKQDREIMRVLVECCLQEKVFNRYYTALASRLCSHDKNHKFTLQYCLWDHFKELELLELQRSMNLARFTAEMLSSFSLSLATLKSVDLTDPKQLTPRRIMHFRMLFEFVFEKTDALVWNIFTRIAALPELEPLRDSLEFFIRQYVITMDPTKSILEKFKVAKKALKNVSGVLK